MTLQTLEEKRSWLMDMIIACPFGKHTHNCEINLLRSVSLCHSLDIVQDLPEQEIDILFEYHEKCSAERRAENGYSQLKAH